eukprot:g33157.t1
MGNGPDIGSVPQVVLGDGKKMHVKLLVGFKGKDQWQVKFCGHWLAKTGEVFKDPKQFDGKIGECKWNPSAKTFTPTDAFRFTMNGAWEDVSTFIVPGMGFAAVLAVLALAYILLGPTGEIARSTQTSYPVPDRARDIVWGRIKNDQLSSNIDGLDGQSYCTRCFITSLSRLQAAAPEEVFLQATGQSADAASAEELQRRQEQRHGLRCWKAFVQRRFMERRRLALADLLSKRRLLRAVLLPWQLAEFLGCLRDRWTDAEVVPGLRQIGLMSR